MMLSSRTGFPAQANALSLLRAERLAAGQEVLDLSSSNPSANGLLHDPEMIARAFGSAANIRYSPDPRGLLPAREAVAAASAKEGAAAVAPEDIYLCASTSEAYGWLFKLLCDPGEAVLVPRPGYPLFDHLAGLEGVRALGYRQEYSHPSGWRIDIEGIERLLGSAEGHGVRALVLINPNNPTGAYVRDTERRGLFDLCARHGLALIVDEVFFRFPLEERPGRSSFIGETGVPCFVLDGLSKRLCLPQAKLGWILVSGPRAEVEAAKTRLDIIADAYLSAGTPVMNALPSLLALEEGIRARTLSRMQASMRAYREILEGPGSPHRVLRCEGGWTALVESPRFAGEEELALRLLAEEGVFAHPGYFFDMEREPHFALSLILEEKTASEGARRYRAAFERMAGILP